MPTKSQAASTTGDQTTDEKKAALLAQIQVVNEKRRGTSNRVAKNATTTNKGEQKLATRSNKTDEEVGFLDDIPVVRADGTVGTLDDLEHPADRKPKATAAANGKKAPAKKPTATQAANASARERMKIEVEKKKVATQLAKIRDEGKKKAAELREKNRLEASKLREQKAEQKKAAAELKKQEREAAAEQKKAEREAARAEKAAAKLRAKGETGNAELDAIFHQAVDSAKALAVVPTDTDEISLGFLAVPGVELTSVGLTLPEGLPITMWAELTRGLRGMQDVTQFAIGDALRYGEAAYDKQYDVVMEALDLEKSTVKNYKYVAGVFEQNERVAGVPFGHHLEVASLKQSNPALALNLLVKAGQERWTQKQLRQAVSEAKGGPTVAQKKQAEAHALVTLGNEQFQADLEEAGSPQAVAKLQKADLDALLYEAQQSNVVPSESTVRNLARLQHLLDEAEADVQIWKERALKAEAQVRSFQNIQVEVGADDAIPAEPEVEDEGQVDEVEEGQDYDDLDATETDDEDSDEDEDES